MGAVRDEESCYEVEGRRDDPTCKKNCVGRSADKNLGDMHNNCHPYDFLFLIASDTLVTVIIVGTVTVFIAEEIAVEVKVAVTVIMAVGVEVAVTVTVLVTAAVTVVVHL